MKKRPPKQPVYEILHRQASVQEQRRQQRVAETRAAEMRVRRISQVGLLRPQTCTLELSCGQQRSDLSLRRIARTLRSSFARCRRARSRRR